MGVLTLEGKPVTNFSDPRRKAKWDRHDVYGDPVYGGLRTIAHLDWTSERAEKKFGHPVEVLQGGFNTDVPASAGTHDFDGCIDYYIPGVDWWEMQAFFRWHGWACWYRYPPKFGRHCHGYSIGCPGRTGVFVPGQEQDYFNHAFGLAGMHTPGSDHSAFPHVIANTIFDYRSWVADKEDDMPKYADWAQADKKALAADVADEVVHRLLSAKLETDPNLTVRGALRTAQNGPGLIRRLATSLGKPLEEKK